ncbi:DUF1405 domain-containing protein [Tuberibacillus sp. Marseille-P3662]|uniref:DUF1405 domain-containing protein n=1 Tax=Tuberibacillus sp. Marseille-P3662 TaxID=1965358 RepID=UPI000A1C86C8|nr:DUF1405 domain-containing protein [Tuberibacillus sp. Marseille-P3662]
MGFYQYFLKQKPLLWLLFVGNVLGTVYGYYWYGSQLSHTPWYFMPFVPDSPTASLFFCLVLLGFLMNKHFPLMEALAVMTLFKYGVWAVGMNITSGLLGQSLTFTHYMLIVSHAWMAIQGLLYMPFYRVKPIHLWVAGLWLVHNEIIDYIFDQMPEYPFLNEYQSVIGYLTFWLSVLTIVLVYFTCGSVKRDG